MSQTSNASSPDLANPEDVFKNIQDLIAEEKRLRESIKALKSEEAAEKANKNLKIDHRMGRTKCDLLAHHIKVKAPGAQYASWQVRPLDQIYYSMVPYVQATCACERAAVAHKAQRTPPVGCLQTDWSSPGSDHRGVGKFDPTYTAKRLFPIKFRLLPAQTAFLQTRFPEYIFVTTTHMSHDHPVAHISTQLGARLLYESLGPGNYLDLYGSPVTNASLNATNEHKTVVTAVATCTFADVIREQTKWRAPHVKTFDREIGTPGAPIDDELIKQCDGLISVHTAYYMSPAEHHAMLSKLNPGAMHVALVHKFAKDVNEGLINNKEQKWVRENGQITQSNVLTDKVYSHADNVWMFGEGWHDAEGTKALALDCSMVCEDLWIVKMCIAPPLALGIAPGAQIPGANVTTPQYDVNSSAYIRQEGFVLLAQPDGTKKLPIKPDLVPVFEKMRKRMLAKPRSASNFKDHASFCRNALATAAKDLGREVDAREYVALVAGTFWVDFSEQVQGDRVMFDANFFECLTAERLYTHGGLADGVQSANNVLSIAEAFTAKDRAGVVRSLIATFKSQLKRR